MGRKRTDLTPDELQAKRAVGRRLLAAEKQGKLLPYLKGLERKHARLLGTARPVQRRKVAN